MIILNSKYFSVFFFLSILLSGCITTRVKNTDTKDNEAIIFGRFILSDKKEIKNNNIILHLFSEDGSPIMAKLDKDGYFYTKAPLGKFYLDRFDYINGIKTYTIPMDYKLGDITSSTDAHYIGDISLSWSPSKEYQTNKFAFKIEKPIRERNAPTLSDIEINNSTIDFFMNKFPENKKSIRISILR